LFWSATSPDWSKNRRSHFHNRGFFYIAFHCSRTDVMILKIFSLLA
jgi:hypothetical protein